MKTINTMKKLIFLSLLSVLTFTVGCSQTSQAETTVDIDAQGPIIKFETNSHDYGTIEQNGNGTYDFKFTNEGTEPLVLTNVRSTCGCTVPQWPRTPIAPGESEIIKVKYNTARVGSFAKSVYVTSNGSTQPVILKIRGKVEPKASTAAK